MFMCLTFYYKVLCLWTFSLNLIRKHRLWYSGGTEPRWLRSSLLALKSLLQHPTHSRLLARFIYILQPWCRTQVQKQGCSHWDRLWDWLIYTFAAWLWMWDGQLWCDALFLELHTMSTRERFILNHCRGLHLFPSVLQVRINDNKKV